MKSYWHTWTLFIQAWKYKWSFKFDNCVKCWTCNSKHKWRWLCIKCWDKEREKSPKRKEIKRKARIKYHKKTYTPVIERKKRVKTFDVKKYQKEWRLKNQEALKLKEKAYRMVKKGVQCLKMIINWQEKHFPFEWLIEKPTTTWNKFTEYEKRKQQQKEFDILKKYYLKSK